MTATQFTDVIISLVSLLALWAFYSVGYADYRRDVYRQKLFGLRNELFDLAADGELTFETPAYKTLRTTLNGFIRFAHRLRFGTLGTFVFLEERAKAKDAERFAMRWAEEVAQLPPATASKMNTIFVKTHRVAFEQLVLTSPLLLVLIFPPIMLFAMKNLGKKLWSTPYAWCREKIGDRWVHALDSAAFEEGGLAIS
jgi:hypothetical protein